MQMPLARVSCSLTLCGICPPLRRFNFPSFVFSKKANPLLLCRRPRPARLAFSEGLTVWLRWVLAARQTLRAAALARRGLCSAPAGLRRSPALAPASCAVKRLREVLAFRKSTWECEAVHLKKKKKSPFAFELEKVAEKDLRWKAGLFFYSASIQACCTSQYWWAARLSLAAKWGLGVFSAYRIT